MEKDGAAPGGGDPLAFFGRWCGPGWSNGRSGEAPLTPAERSGGAIVVRNAKGDARQSPVDLACRLHDLQYEAIAAERDPVRAARMTVAADRTLFITVSRLIAQQAEGRNDLNIGEVLYAKDVRIAFGGKLLFDNMEVAEQVRRRAFAQAEAKTRAALRIAMPYALLISAGAAGGVPMIVRLYQDLPAPARGRR